MGHQITRGSSNKLNSGHVSASVSVENAPQPEKSPSDEQEFTYQDVMEKFGVCYRTVLRWFAKRPIFRPNGRGGTVRIRKSQLDAFILERTRRLKKKI